MMWKFGTLSLFLFAATLAYGEQNRNEIADAIDNFFAGEKINAAPEVPGPGIDESIGKTEELTPADFFKSRREATKCRKYLNAYKAKDRALKKALEAAIASGKSEAELREKAKGYDMNRNQYLKKLTECGDCYVSRGQQLILPAEMNQGTEQTWYLADGSCLMHSEDENDIAKGFERAKTWITNADNYAQKNGGVQHLLEFDGVGETLPGYPDYPRHTFLAVKGDFSLKPGQDPVFMRVFTYFIENWIIPADTTHELQVIYKKVDDVEGYERPDTIYNLNPIGQKIAVDKKDIEELIEVQGMWYINDEGWLRYYTAAVFKTDPGKFLGVWTAKRILQSTLLQVVEKTYEVDS